MFGNSSLPSRGWKYGALPPLPLSRIPGLLQTQEPRDLFEQQAYLGHKYANKLRELELLRRNEAQDIIRAECPRLAELHEETTKVRGEIDEILARLKAARRLSRRRDVTRGEEAEAVGDLRARLKTLYAEEKPLRKKTYQETAVRRALDKLTKLDRQRRKDARKHSGLYWGNYIVVEQAASLFRSGPPPVLCRYSGDGRIAVQLQNGISWQDATSCKHNVFRLEVTGEVLSHQNGARPRKRIQARAWIRCGSAAKGKPIWVVVPVVIHRLPPPGVKIKWVYLHRRLMASSLRPYRVDDKEVWLPDGYEIGYSADRGETGVTENRPTGSTEVWQLTMVLAHADSEVWRPAGQVRGPDAGQVGVDLGFRMVADGLRVATFFGSDGYVEHLTLPTKLVDRFRFGDRLQSVIDSNFNEMRDRLVASVDAAGCLVSVPDDASEESGDPVPIPEWLAEAMKTIGQWKSKSRLVGLYCRWCDNRFPGDEKIWDLLDAWRRQHFHLSQWRQHEGDQLREHRLSLYRAVAARLRRRYRLVCLENVNWRGLLKRRDKVVASDGDDMLVASQRDQARIASPGLLGQVLTLSIAESVKVPSFDTTRMCAECGTLNEWDQAKELIHTCRKCEARWDQDTNAARNILREGLRTYAGQEPGGLGVADAENV